MKNAVKHIIVAIVAILAVTQAALAYVGASPICASIAEDLGASQKQASKLTLSLNQALGELSSLQYENRRQIYEYRKCSGYAFPTNAAPRDVPPPQSSEVASSCGRIYSDMMRTSYAVDRKGQEVNDFQKAIDEINRYMDRLAAASQRNGCDRATKEVGTGSEKY